jgi:hypothetical protein
MPAKQKKADPISSAQAFIFDNFDIISYVGIGPI